MTTATTKTPAGAATGLPEGEGEIWLSATALIARHPGPAVLVGPDAAVRAANDGARDLLDALSRGEAGALAEALAEAGRSGTAAAVTVILPNDLGGGVLNLAVMPVPAADGAPGLVLALARDASLDHRLRDTLVESRQRYKDLVDCSADFAWETGPDGRFVFVSPTGVLGFTANDMIDHHPSEFLVTELTPDDGSLLPFASDQPTEDKLVWMRTVDGRPACLKVSSVPLYGGDGTWCGARGVSQDVTAARAKDLLLEIARRRERALAAVIQAMRSEVRPQVMLEAAARAIADTLGLAACWILRRREDGTPYLATAAPSDAEPPDEVGERLAAVAGGEKGGVVEVGPVLLAPSHHGDKANGGVAVARHEGEGWSEDDRDLLAGIAGHVGIAIEQASTHEQLHVLSRTDALTGLLNRRAFLDEADRRLGHARRNRRAAAVLYVDFDNFKALNDRHGHGAGDAALVAVSRMIAEGSRAGDIVARVGGDELVMWLDETDRDGAESKAAALIAGIDGLTDLPRVAERPLALSIGIATFDPDTMESLEALLERADAGMYQAKQRQHGTSSYAPGPAVGAG